MNKYIRTKDCIYEIDKNISYGGKEIYKVRNHDFSIIGNSLQKADTIEKLCDELVVRDGFVYGAILTDKGLVCVAKMNKKTREFELL